MSRSNRKNGLEKKKFKGSDEMIRKAFKIYSDRDLENSMRDFDFEYNDDKIFEDKIYSVINKLPIKNPRSKAHIICIVIICLALLLGVTLGYIYMGSRKQAGETNVLESICSDAKKRYEIGDSSVIMSAESGYELNLETEEDGRWYYYNNQNTAVYVNTKDYTESGYLYVFYQLNDYEIRKLTKKGVELKKADKTDKLTPFLENAPEKSKYSIGSIYFIGGRSSRKFIIFKDRADDMYIGKCVGFQSLKEHDIISDEKSGERNEISSGEFLKNTMDIKDGDDIREIILERVKAKSKDEPEKRIAIWSSDESRSEFCKLLTKGNSIKMGEQVKQGFSRAVESEPQNCYYMAVENKESEICILGVILGEKDVEVYVEPQYKSGTLLKLSAENAKKLRKIIKENDK